MGERLKLVRPLLYLIPSRFTLYIYRSTYVSFCHDAPHRLRTRRVAVEFDVFN